ncbi:Protein Max [Manis pentadactyla]|nr:Protein Max [Manis pentadactyla]
MESDWPFCSVRAALFLTALNPILSHSPVMRRKKPCTCHTVSQCLPCFQAVASLKAELAQLAVSWGGYKPNGNHTNQSLKWMELSAFMFKDWRQITKPGRFTASSCS